MHFEKIFNILLRHFGVQGWWHADSNFEICAGIILVQRTTWINADKAIYNLKKKKSLNPQKIISVASKKLESALRSAGFYKQKAKYLKNFARYYLKKGAGRNDFWHKFTVDEIRKELLEIEGIGPESADSILLYAADKPVFIADAYTKRILIRIGIIDKNYTFSDIKSLVQREIKPNLSNVKDYKELHALLVELAKQFCKTKPICEACPLKRNCKKFI